ncbi:aspartyl protease family protein At5g10770 [Jatropha curcas]|uniref:aspartyl protease family protein At5g10770 n=1 Tax=Jatropha curcas TaxID=180498 RepID=UPI001893D772|nr:aspartyl protease family protein At5g10770 [Jatropha curcas]
MATSFSHSYFLIASLFYLFLFSFFLEKNAHAFQEKKLFHQHTHTIQVSNLLPSTACKHSPKVAENSATLKVVHRRGSCIHLNQDNANSPNGSEILHEDQSRVNSIHSRISGNLEETKATSLPAKIGASLGTANFIVTVGLGTPTKDLQLIFDTGSDLTWARCQPNGDTFDPTQSTSYANVPCSSPLCSSSTGGALLRCSSSSSTCVYGLQYGDGSISTGLLGQERLSLGTTDAFDNFYFGCARNIQGTFQNVDGLLGLGRGKLSVVSQTASNYNKLFSYCLPSDSSTGFLSLGASQSNSAKFVPLSSTSSDFYFLDLTGITVGGRKLSIPNSVFSTSGTIIDSGTVITRLPPAAYSALQSAFQELMSQYPKAQPLSILDTCYDFSNFQTVNVPKIVLSFNGATDVEVAQSGIFFGNGAAQVCLAFAPNSDPRDKAIFGNKQQLTYEVIYDVSGGKVGFAAAGCS